MIRSRHHRWNPPTLFSKRLQLRPLNDDDFTAWSEVRLRNADWLLKWEPLRPAYAPDPAVERSAYVNRCRARERETAADQACWGDQPQQRRSWSTPVSNFGLLDRPGPSGQLVHV